MTRGLHYDTDIQQTGGFPARAERAFADYLIQNYIPPGLARQSESLGLNAFTSRKEGNRDRFVVLAQFLRALVGRLALLPLSHVNQP
jgi:hypothetical protein